MVAAHHTGSMSALFGSAVFDVKFREETMTSSYQDVGGGIEMGFD